MIKEKVKTGVSGLDDMLEGGLIPGRAYVVSGTSGTGKTTLAMQFLLEGARKGERVIYISIDEPPNEVKQNMRSFAWDLGRVQVFDATPDIMSYDKTPVRDVSTERKVVYFNDVGRERHNADLGQNPHGHNREYDPGAAEAGDEREEVFEGRSRFPDIPEILLHQDERGKYDDDLVLQAPFGSRGHEPPDDAVAGDLEAGRRGASGKRRDKAAQMDKRPRSYARGDR
jgi:hypothetical protein